jgi:hypothetical protein
MALSDGQLDLVECDARFRILIAGRRFGKSYLCMRELAKAAGSKPNQKVWYVSPSYRMSKQILWNPLKAKLLDLNWVKKVNESDLSITLVNGSVISLRGADNWDSLRGVGLNAVILDEFADIKEEAWTEVLRPTLSDTGGWALFCGTPKGLNWAYDLYQRGQDPEEKAWKSFSYTTLQGGRVPEEEVKQARLDLDERTFRQEYEAVFANYSGIVYYAFDIKENVKKVADINTSLIYVGIDFNIDPMSAVLAVKTPTGLHIFDEIVLFGSNTDELADEIKNRYPNSRIVAFPDPAGAAGSTKSGGRTDHTILRNANFTVKVRNSHPAIRDRVNSVNSLLCNIDNQRRLTIDPKCKKVIESLTKQVYKSGTTIPEKTGADHMNDALGYMCEFLYPVRRETDIGPTITKWNVQTI